VGLAALDSPDTSVVGSNPGVPRHVRAKGLHALQPCPTTGEGTTDGRDSHRARAAACELDCGRVRAHSARRSDRTTRTRRRVQRHRLFDHRRCARRTGQRYVHGAGNGRPVRSWSGSWIPDVESGRFLHLHAERRLHGIGHLRLHGHRRRGVRPGNGDARRRAGGHADRRGGGRVRRLPRHDVDDPRVDGRARERQRQRLVERDPRRQRDARLAVAQQRRIVRVQPGPRLHGQ